MVRPKTPRVYLFSYTLSPITGVHRILVLSATAAISTSGVVAPRIEIYTRTICEVYGVDAASDACLADRAVQAAVARLITVLSTTSGLLATLTTAWWGSVSSPCLVNRADAWCGGRWLMGGWAAVGSLWADMGVGVQCGGLDGVRP